MRRVMLALLTVATVLSAHGDSLDAGSKKKLGYATCAAPFASCYAPTCAGCAAPGCFAPSCAGCAAPGCFAPSCAGPMWDCGGCAAPGCAGPYGSGWNWSDPYGGPMPMGPLMGGMRPFMTNGLTAATEHPPIPAIPPAEDLVW